MDSESPKPFPVEPEVLTTCQATPNGGTILEVQLNRPAKRNALNLRALEQLLCAVNNPEVSQIVFTGSGPAFCSGLDLAECRRVATWPVRSRHLELLELVYARLLMTRAHTIAFVQGYVVGGGVGLAACADRLIASHTARFRIPRGELAKLAHIVHPLTAARQAAAHRVECWLAGEISALQARACGLVDEVLAPDEFARQIEEARQVIARSPAETMTWRSPQVCQRVLTEIQEILEQHRA